MKQNRVRSAWLVGLATAVVAASWPGASSALSFAPTISLDILGGAPATTMNPFGLLVPAGGTAGNWTLTTSQLVEGATVDSWTVGLDEDPFVTNNIVVTNTTGSTQTFIASVLLPIPAFGYNSVINSSLGVTATDSNADNLLSFANSVGPTPIYQGAVNGATVLLTLNPNSPVPLPLTTASCPVPFPGCSATSAAGVAFLAVTPGVANSIGLTLTFDLSPGDSAGITSRFEVVPEPGTAALLGVGLVALGTLLRRRR